MKRFIFIAWILAALIGHETTYAQAPAEMMKQKLKEKDMCPEFVFKTREGQEARLQDFRGKYVVIDVWASWCYPCKKEYPNVKKMAEKYQEKNIVFVGISCDQSERRWMDEMGFIHMTGHQWWITPGNDFMTAFEVGAIPRLILLDKKGRVAKWKLPAPSDPEFERILSKLKGL